MTGSARTFRLRSGSSNVIHPMPSESISNVGETLVFVATLKDFSPLGSLLEG
jgi:hypothetical protein